MAVKRGLGKGLDALFYDNATEDGTSAPEQLRLSEIEPNREQPRKDFDPEALETLADSIRQNGLLQPLLVRPMPSGGYQLVAGERRWRASRMAGLTEVPAIIREMDDAKAMELALIENLQRENLNALEEAMGYNELIERYQMTQEDVSKSVGKSRSAVANTLRLLTLAKPVQEMLRKGELSAGHARTLIGLPEERQEIICHKIIKEKLSVRDAEALAKEKEEKPAPARKMIHVRDSFYRELEIAFKNSWNREVQIVETEKKRELRIVFSDKDDLLDLIKQITHGDSL